MKLISVNIGQKRTQQRKNHIETTGIYKFPVHEPLEIKSLSIEQLEIMFYNKEEYYPIKLRTFPA